MTTRKDEAGLVMDLLAKASLPVPRLGRFEVDAIRSPVAPADVLARLREFGGRGWVCFTDKVVSVEDATGLPDGVPLSAELCDRNESLHLRQDGAGWLLVHLTSTDGDEHLIFTEHRPKLGGGVLVYEVAWRREVEAWRPWCARLSHVIKGEN